MQDKMPAIAKPSVRYNDTGRDGQSKLPTHLIIPERCIGTQTQLPPSHFIYPSKGGRAFPCFQPALLINHWGGNKKGTSCQPDQGLKRKSPTSQAYFLVLFVGVQIREAILSVLNPATSKGCKPHDVFLSVLLRHKFRSKAGHKTQGLFFFLLCSPSHLCMCPLHRH